MFFLLAYAMYFLFIYFYIVFYIRIEVMLFLLHLITLWDYPGIVFV